MPPKRKAIALPEALAPSATRSKRVRVASAARALLEPDIEEAPEPAVEKAPAPAKRGRKAKTTLEVPAEQQAEAPEPAKRGRRAAPATGEGVAEEADVAKSAAASKKITAKARAEPKSKAAKAKAEPKSKAEPRPEAEPKPMAESKTKAELKPKKASSKTATASPKKAAARISTTSPKKSPAKTSPKKVPSPIKTTLAVPRASRKAATSAGYEADESRPATAAIAISPKIKAKKVAPTKPRVKSPGKGKAASPTKSKGKATTTSVSARGARGRRAAVEAEEAKDEQEDDDDEEDDEGGPDFEERERRATPSRLNHGPVHELAAWRLARDAPAGKSVRSGRATAAGKAGKAGKATTERSKAAQDDLPDSPPSTTTPNLHALSLTDLQSLLASWSGGNSIHSSHSSSALLDAVAESASSLIPSYSERIASSTSALADIVSTLSEAVLAVQSELAIKRKAADERVQRWAEFALWHHERVVRLAERLERELVRVGSSLVVLDGGQGKATGQLAEKGVENLAGAMRLVARICDWSDDGAVRCAEACQRGEGPCEECGREAPVVEKEKEESLPDYEDDEEEEVVIVVESEVSGQDIQRHCDEDEGQRSADSYGNTHGHGNLSLPSTLPAATADVRPTSARSTGSHRASAITTASLTYTQAQAPQSLPAPPTSQLRPASMNSNPPPPVTSALSALSALISPTSPPSSSGSVDGDDTSDDHLYDDLFESEAPMAALSGPLQAAAVTYPSLLSQPGATSPRYEPAQPQHFGPAHLNATSAAYQPAQSAQPSHPQYAHLHPCNNDDVAGMSERLLNAPYGDDEVIVTPPPDRRGMEEVSYEYQGSFHGRDEGVPTFSPVVSSE